MCITLFIIIKTINLYIDIYYKYTIIDFVAAVPSALESFRLTGESIPHSPLIQEPFMLVLSRKKNESIVINDDIVVTIVDVRGDKVRLGIEAPRYIPVHRREVLDAIMREQELADAGKANDSQAE